MKSLFSVLGGLLKQLVKKLPLLAAYLVGKRGAENEQLEKANEKRREQQKIGVSPRKSRSDLLKWMRNKNS